MQPEELTELLDDDLEMWAQGGTRILPPSQLARAVPPPANRGPKPDSLPPVAYPSMPPPSMPPSTGGTPVWAALVGMAVVFFFAAIGGGVFYALHRSADATTTTTESTASQSAAPETTSEPQQVTLTTTSEPVAITAPIVTSTTTQKVSPAIVAPPPAVRYGTIQTFAVGAGKPVFLDGKQIGTGGSHIKAACGKHAVSVGSGKAKSYDIPCTGTTIITVGTPDGA